MIMSLLEGLKNLIAAEESTEEPVVPEETVPAEAEVSQEEVPADAPDNDISKVLELLGTMNERMDKIEKAANKKPRVNASGNNAVTPPSNVVQPPKNLQEQVQHIMNLPKADRAKPEIEDQLRKAINQIGREKASLL